MVTRPKHTDPSRADRPLVWAHRGASAAERENTVAAFEAAVAMGADGVELDVRRAGDGALVVHHDPAYDDGRTVSEVVAADRPDHVPLLDEALDACGDLVVNIEIKNGWREPDFDRSRSVAPEIVDVVAERGWTDRVVVSSFDLGMVDRIRQLDAAVPSAWLVHLGLRRVLLDRCVRHGHGLLHPWDRMVSPAFVTAARARGLGLNVWTVDEPDRIGELAELGVDGIVTNVPDIALDALDPA